jgi:hypothetical protein
MHHFRIKSNLLNREFHEVNDLFNISSLRESDLNPLRIFGSVWMNARISRVFKALAVDNALGETDVQFAVVVKMGKLLAAVKKGRESIIPARPRAILNSELLESLN